MQKECDSYEHIIPDSIGGTLQLKILCAKCNKNIGSEVVSQIKKDLQIRLAIENLKDEIPNIYKRYEEGQSYLGETKNGDIVEFKRDKKGFKPKFKNLGNSQFLETNDGIRNIKSEMVRLGETENSIKCAIAKMKKLPDDIIVHIHGDLWASCPSISNFQMDYKHVEVSDRLPVLISYEFLALVCGSMILDTHFDNVRQLIMKGIEHKDIEVGRYISSAEKYQPVHSIFLECMSTSIIVNVILFDWIWYKITYHNLHLNTKEFFYRNIIVEKRSELALSYEHAKANKFIDLVYNKYPLE
jgi:hypothetical protein